MVGKSGWDFPFKMVHHYLWLDWNRSAWLVRCFLSRE